MTNPSGYPCANQAVSDNQSKKNHRIGSLEKVWNYKGKGFVMAPDPVANGKFLQAFGVPRVSSIKSVVVTAHKHVSITKNHWVSQKNILKFCKEHDERTIRRALKICVEVGMATKRKNGREVEYYFDGLYYYLSTGQVLSIEHLSKSYMASKDSGQNYSGQNARNDSGQNYNSGQNARYYTGHFVREVQHKYTILLDKQTPILLSKYNYMIKPRSMDSVVFNTASTTNTEKKSAPSPSPSLKTASKTPRTNKADTPDTEKKSAPSPSLKTASKTPKINKADSSKRVKMFRELNSNPESRRLLASINASDADLRVLISVALKTGHGTKAIIKALVKSINSKVRNPIAYARAILRNPPKGLTKAEETSQYNYLKAQSKEAALAAQQQKQRREDIKAIEDKLKTRPYNGACSIAECIGINTGLLAGLPLGITMPSPDRLKKKLLGVKKKAGGGTLPEVIQAFLTYDLWCTSTA